MSTSPKRNFDRIPVLIPATIRCAGRPSETIEAEITNLSPGGAFVKCRAAFQTDQELTIEIRFLDAKVLMAKVSADPPPSPPETSLSLSKVRWVSEPGPQGFGIEFINPEPSTQAFLAQLVAYYTRLSKAGVSFL